MAYIFLDESGDLGFDFIKKKTSKFFIVTCLFTESKTPIEKIVLYNSEEKTLQAVGFVSWAIFRKYEYADDTFYNIIKNRMVEENPLFP